MLVADLERRSFSLQRRRSNQYSAWMGGWNNLTGAGNEPGLPSNPRKP